MVVVARNKSTTPRVHEKPKASSRPKVTNCWSRQRVRNLEDGLTELKFRSLTDLVSFISFYSGYRAEFPLFWKKAIGEAKPLIKSAKPLAKDVSDAWLILIDLFNKRRTDPTIFALQSLAEVLNPLIPLFVKMVRARPASVEKEEVATFFAGIVKVSHFAKDGGRLEAKARKLVEQSGCKEQLANLASPAFKQRQIESFRMTPRIKEKIAISYDWLIAFVARKYDGLGVEWEDLMADGREGLCIALDRYDPKRGALFSTYAYYWIFMKISRACQRARKDITLSLKFYELRQAVKARWNCEEAPTEKDLIKLLFRYKEEVFPAGVKKRATIVGNAKLLCKYWFDPEPVSFEQSVSKEANGRCFEESFVDPRQQPPEELLAAREAFAAMQEALDRLPWEGDAEVFRLSWGMGGEGLPVKIGTGEQVYSYRTVGQELGYSGERVRQKLERATKRLTRRMKAQGYI